MKKGGNHHVFCDKEPYVPNLAHDQGGNPQEMRHVRNIGSFAPLGVDLTRIVHGARKPATQLEWFGLIVVHVLAFLSHCASMHTVYELRWILSVLFFIANSFYGGYDSFLSPIDVCNRHCPERNQIDPGYELGYKRW